MLLVCCGVVLVVVPSFRCPFAEAPKRSAHFSNANPTLLLATNPHQSNNMESIKKAADSQATDSSSNKQQQRRPHAQRSAAAAAGRATWTRPSR